MKTVENVTMILTGQFGTGGAESNNHPGTEIKTFVADKMTNTTW